jgi:hypothetical protein
VVALVIIGVVLYQVQLQEHRMDALAAALEAEQQALEDRGETPVAADPEEIIEDPDVDPPAPVGPTDEQVQAAVEAYFREHPVQDGENASPAQIAVAVINYLSENPPAQGEPGPPPSAEQISNAVAAHLAANPPPPGPPGPAGTNGTDGKDGADGKDAELTSERIQAELDAYLEAHPPQRCDPGWEYGVVTVLTTGPPTEIATCLRVVAD